MGDALAVHEIWADELCSIQRTTEGPAGEAGPAYVLIGDILATGRSHADRYAELQADDAEPQADCPQGAGR